MRVDGEWIHGCPITQVDRDAWEALHWYGQMERGITPVSLGWVEWVPWPFMEAMREVQTAKAKGENERAARRALAAKG